MLINQWFFTNGRYEQKDWILILTFSWGNMTVEASKSVRDYRLWRLSDLVNMYNMVVYSRDTEE